jgi:hypothetical protein
MLMNNSPPLEVSEEDRIGGGAVGAGGSTFELHEGISQVKAKAGTGAKSNVLRAAASTARRFDQIKRDAGMSTPPFAQLR